MVEAVGVESSDAPIGEAAQVSEDGGRNVIRACRLPWPLSESLFDHILIDSPVIRHIRMRLLYNARDHSVSIGLEMGECIHRSESLDEGRGKVVE